MTPDDRATNLAYRVGAATAALDIAADRLERVTNRLAGEYGIGLSKRELAEILAYMRDKHTELTDNGYDWREVEERLDATMGKR